MTLSAYYLLLDLIEAFPHQYFAYHAFWSACVPYLLPNIVTIFPAPINLFATFLILQIVKESVHMIGGREETSTWD
jgi:hypothetical protein